jgi:hypothetical protein
LTDRSRGFRLTRGFYFISTTSCAEEEAMEWAIINFETYCALSPAFALSSAAVSILLRWETPKHFRVDPPSYIDSFLSSLNVMFCDGFQLLLYIASLESPLSGSWRNQFGFKSKALPCLIHILCS